MLGKETISFETQKVRRILSTQADSTQYDWRIAHVPVNLDGAPVPQLSSPINLTVVKSLDIRDIREVVVTSRISY